MNNDSLVKPADGTIYKSEMVKTYVELFEPLSKQYAQAMLKLIGPVIPGTRVLDVAAGTGVVGLLAAKAGATLVATDISPQMVDYLQGQLKEFPNCSALQMDGQALYLPDETFDVSFSALGIMTFPDWRKGLKELVRVTRKDGFGGLTVFKNPLGAEVMVIFCKAYELAFPEKPKIEALDGMKMLSNPEVLSQEMLSAGFQEIVTIEHIGIQEWAGMELFLTDTKRIYSFMPQYKTLSESEREQLLPALREIAMKYMISSKISLSSVALLAKGKRK